MADFPRTTIENLSVSRLIIGTNWFLGYSHTTKAKDTLIVQSQHRKELAAILEVFFRAGVDTLYGVRPESPHLEEAVKDAEDRTGRACIKMGIPTFDLGGSSAATDNNRQLVDNYAHIGCKVLLPHQATTDALVDRVQQNIDGVRPILKFIRDAGMVPGLSTHMPETVPYADRTGLDIGTYIQMYNAAGFLMQVEVDWVHRIIQQAAHPVITIKPLAAGRLHPLVGLAFNWATIRPQDMVCVGCFTPDEARECIEISLSQLEQRAAAIDLQTTRSKKSLG